MAIPMKVHAIDKNSGWLCYTKRLGGLDSLRITVSRITSYSPLQLGHGPGSSGRLVPKRVEALRKVFAVGVAAGTEHTAVVARSGVVSVMSEMSERKQNIVVPRAYP